MNNSDVGIIRFLKAAFVTIFFEAKVIIFQTTEKTKILNHKIKD